MNLSLSPTLPLHLPSTPCPPRPRPHPRRRFLLIYPQLLVPCFLQARCLRRNLARSPWRALKSLRLVKRRLQSSLIRAIASPRLLPARTIHLLRVPRMLPRAPRVHPIALDLLKPSDTTCKCIEPILTYFCSNLCLQPWKDYHQRDRQ